MPTVIPTKIITDKYSQVVSNPIQVFHDWLHHIAEQDEENYEVMLESPRVIVSNLNRVRSRGKWVYQGSVVVITGYCVIRIPIGSPPELVYGYCPELRILIGLTPPLAFHPLPTFVKDKLDELILSGRAWKTSDRSVRGEAVTPSRMAGLSFFEAWAKEVDYERHLQARSLNGNPESQAFASAGAMLFHNRDPDQYGPEILKYLPLGSDHPTEVRLMSFIKAAPNALNTLIQRMDKLDFVPSGVLGAAMRRIAAFHTY